jgi:heptosyltransferase-2
MPASPESVSSNAPSRSGSTRVLVVSLSWLGDCVMAMPALLALRKRLPGVHVAILSKPSVAPLWELCTAVDEVIPLKKGFAGILGTVRAVRRARLDFAYVLPKSFRAAWIPFLARISGRRGMPGHGRDWMLTEVARLSEDAVRGHQSLEIADVFHIPHGDLVSPPFLAVTAKAKDEVRGRIADAFGNTGAGVVAFFPGAAYGPSKRWPAGRFAEVGRQLAAEKGWRVVVLGTAADRELGEQVAAGIGAAAVNWAGQTSFSGLVALLGECRAVLANDSGGMHLAAALGVPVVGIFGMTDPVKTAPIGPRACVLAAEGINRSRDIARDSAEARAAMESISVERVYQAVSSTLRVSPG